MRLPTRQVYKRNTLAKFVLFGSLRGLIHPAVGFPAHTKGCYVTPLEQVRTCVCARCDFASSCYWHLYTVLFHSHCAELQWSGRKKILWALLSYTKKCLFCGIRTIPNIITNYTSIFPPGAVNNWWITARNPFAGMRAVLSEPTPRVEHNPALLRYAVTLRQIAQAWTRPKT